ncbi:cysteine-rich CWC family protein [Crocinitomix algicola]|uniref:cysteine-rich CWC family protein n=1 Tax=Crocinitomix algicola TaxID=1740263 RepID=UPI0009F6AFF7
MKKQCTKCHASFECKVEEIENCHCTKVKLEQEILEQLRNEFEDCLCPKCLDELSRLSQ